MLCFGSPSKTHRCKIILLDDTELIQEIQNSHKGQHLLDIVFKHLSLLETVYFGLRFVNRKGYSCWLQSNKSITKQLKGVEPITFYFGVKFYASDPCKLLEESTRYQFFLQIKQDIQQYRLPVTNELAAQLLAYIIQSELGDYDPRHHHYGYVSEFRLIPNQSNDFENKVCDLHKKLIGQIPAAVELQFLERIKWLDLYGCQLHPVIAEDANEYCLGLGPHGIIVLKNKLKVGNYFWPRVVKAFRKSQFFIIKVIDKENETNTYGFEMVNKNASKYIYHNCKEHQEFFKLCQNSNNLRHDSRWPAATPNRTRGTNGERPAPTFVRVPSRRYQKMGLPDGSEGNDESNAYFKSNVQSARIPRHNSTPSLIKNEPTKSTRYTTLYAPYDGPERGLFSKSASASPLSVRSAFVSCYDYGRHNYVSHMKRDSSYLSLPKSNRHLRVSDNESEISKCSRSSRHSSRSHKFRHNRHSEDSGTESDSSRKRRHRRKHRISQEQPQLVAWNQIVEKRQEPLSRPSNAVLRTVNGFAGQNAVDGEVINFPNKFGYQRQFSEEKKYLPYEQNNGALSTAHSKREAKLTNIESEWKHSRKHEDISYNDSSYYQPEKVDSYNSNSYGKHIKFRYEYHQKPVSAVNINDNSNYDKDSRYSNGNLCTNYSSYLGYGKSKTLANMADINLSSNTAQSTTTPRVTFQTPHRTAYFSNNEVYQGESNHNNTRSSATNIANAATTFSHQESKKSNEMSTEL